MEATAEVERLHPRNCAKSEATKKKTWPVLAEIAYRMDTGVDVQALSRPSRMTRAVAWLLECTPSLA